MENLERRGEKGERERERQEDRKRGGDQVAGKERRIREKRASYCRTEG